MTVTSAPATMAGPLPMRRAFWWLIVLGIWTVFPLLSALQSAFYSAYVGRDIIWRDLLPLRVADWYTCALFTPVCFWLVRRFPLQRGLWLRNAAMQLIVISMVVALKFALYVEVGRRLRPDPDWRLDRIMAGGFISESIAFWALLGIVHAVEYYRRFREREVHAARLEAELAGARLDALTAQLQPHFLFNTLHSISTLMRRDVDAAEEMLAHLGDLLHRTLRQQQRHEIPLAEELELLRHYLDIMKIRFQDRLAERIDLQDGVAAALVPPFLLQPLVENAIRHGIARKPGAGLIEIAACRAGDSLEITVRNDGEGFAPGGEGVGLSNTRRRLEELYGPQQGLDLVPEPGGGLLVRIVIPFRPS